MLDRLTRLAQEAVEPELHPLGALQDLVAFLAPQTPASGCGLRFTFLLHKKRQADGTRRCLGNSDVAVAICIAPHTVRRPESSRAVRYRAATPEIGCSLQ